MSMEVLYFIPILAIVYLSFRNGVGLSRRDTLLTMFGGVLLFLYSLI